MTLAAHELACLRGPVPLFSDLSFTLAPGHALRVRGRNGSGKTSLLRLLCGLSRPAAGSVRWSERDVLALRDEFHRELLHVGHLGGVKDDLSALENVQIASRLSGRPCTRGHALQALAAVGLEDAAALPCRALSQGQRKRVALARLYVPPRPRLLVFDEPATALDADAVRHLCSALDQHLAAGGLLVYTTHQDLPLRARHEADIDLDTGSLEHEDSVARPC